MDTAAVDACFACLVHDEALARPLLEQAHAAATDAATRRLLAAGALLAINVEFADFRGLADWLQRFEAAADAVGPDRPQDRARLDAALLTRPSLDDRFAPDDDAVQAAAERLFEALRRGLPVSVDERLLLAKALYDYHGLQDNRSRCERVAALANDGLAQGGASLDWQGRWWLVQEAALAYWEPLGAAAQAREQAAALVRQGAGVSVDLGLGLAQLRHALAANDPAAQDRAFAHIERLRTRVRSGLALRALHAQAGLQTRRGQFRAALERLDLVLGLCEDVEVPERDRGVYHEQRAYALAGLGRWSEALDVFDRMRHRQTGHQARMVDVIQGVLRGAAALDEAWPDSRAQVRQAMQAAAQVNWRRFLAPLPRTAARLAAAALDDGVEPDFVRASVRERRLTPEDPWREHWPWRLKLVILGEPTLLRDDEPLRASGKAQKKPLELLALLAASGGGPLDADAVIDALWPSLEAHAPRGSLDMTVSRLRKLLEVPDAVLLTEGRLQLNPALVWIDAVAFEARCDAAERGDETAAALALALYRQRLLGSEKLQGRLLAARTRLARRFTQLALDHGQRLLARGDATAALRVVDLALQHDELSEPLYRLAIRAQLALGEQAEALRTGERCRAALLQALGVVPSAETLALLQAGGRSSSRP